MNKDERQTIYEIYRACRLCGAGAGYKMPIIQSVIDVDAEETELKHKIRECVQIEVSLTDRLPPLICELCVDKINDFFDFRAMCHETNRKTRLRLGLPQQTTIKEEPVSDCIVGDTETVYINSDSDEGEPLSKQTSNVKFNTNPKSKIKKENDLKVKIENNNQMLKEKSPDVKDWRDTKRRSSPKRTTRQNPRTNNNKSLSDLQGVQIQKSTRSRPAPKSVKKKREEIPDDDDGMSEENSLLVPRMKRPLEIDVFAEVLPKKPKLPEPPKHEILQRPGPKSSKLAPKQIPQQKPQVPKAGPKSKKRDPSPVPVAKSRKSESTPVSVPKTRKSEPTQGPGTKSRKSESVTPPTSKSKRIEPPPALQSRKSKHSPVAGPKSKKLEFSKLITSKSKKSDSLPVPTSKSKRPELTPPGPKSKKREREASLPPKIDRASTTPHRSFICRICGAKTKTSQGQSSHMKTHTPTITPIKLSCNACELWFPSMEEATWHHNQHINKGLSYTCPKCYDAFQTPNDYELHLTRNQCLPSYEVPDVKCEDCWHYYPTYKLLEDHKCPGEGGRPGGKCSKCRRSYALLKTLTVHEMRCNVKKKVTIDKEQTDVVKSTPIVDPEVASRLLPMQVRISKCDPLLKNSLEGRCDVTGVSHTFGLDFNYTYPYLDSMGDVTIKTEPALKIFDTMVAIKDEIKEEYLNEDSYVHWDSDASEDIDCETLFKAIEKKKSVDSLSTISLKTLFSPKCLGKVPRGKRKIQSEKGFESVLSFHCNIKRSIDNISDNLGNESQHSDNYDSDSILSKTVHQNEVSNLENMKLNVTENTGAFESTVEDVKAKDVKAIAPEKIDSASNTVKESESTINEEIVSENTDLKQKHVNNQTNESVNEVTNLNKSKSGDKTSSEMISNSASKDTENNLDLESKAMQDSETVSQNNNENELRENAQSIQEVRKEFVSEIVPNVIEDKVETSAPEMAPQKEEEHIETKPGNYADTSSVVSEPIVVDTKTLKQEIPLSNNDDINTETNDSRSSNAINYKAIEDVNAEEIDPRSSDAINDKVNHNDNTTTAEWKNETEKYDALNDKENHCHSITNETNKDIDDNESFTETNDKTNHCGTSKSESENIAIDNSSLKTVCDDNKVNDAISNSITFRNSKENYGVKDVQIADKFNINDLSDEDKRLMADLDAHIGESDSKGDVFGENEQEGVEVGENRRENCVIGEKKSLNEIDRNNSSGLVIASVGFSDMNSEENNDSLEGLIQKQDDLKSLDLDSISDEEFNFDI